VTKPHNCADCLGCECSGTECDMTCDRDCGCPDYPPPETWDVASGAAGHE